MSQYTHIVEVPEDTEMKFLFQKVLLAEMAFLSLSLSLSLSPHTHTHTHRVLKAMIALCDLLWLVSFTY